MISFPVVWIFLSIACFFALAMIFARNVVHSAIFLVLSFLSVACTFVSKNSEFLGMIIVIVYVGAIVVLFLFVMMMMRDRALMLYRPNLASYAVIGVGFGLFLLEFFVLFWVKGADQETWISPMKTNINFASADNMANILYTDLFLYFQSAGVILLVSMIAVILLTRQHKRMKFISLRQSSLEQIEKVSDIKLVSVPLRAGTRDSDSL